MGAYKWFMQTEFGGPRSHDQNVTARNWAESGHFEPIYLGQYRF